MPLSHTVMLDINAHNEMVYTQNPMLSSLNLHTQEKSSLQRAHLWCHTAKWHCPNRMRSHSSQWWVQRVFMPISTIPLPVSQAVLIAVVLV